MSNDSIELSEDLLMKAGGWREMKEARQIHRSGKVSDARYEDGLLEALLSVKGRATKVRLRIRSATDMENFCPCPPARREGIICAHVLAAGLEVLDPQAPNPIAERETSSQPKVVVPKLSDQWSAVTETATDDAEPAELFVILAPNLAGAWEKGRLIAGIEIELDGERKLLAALPKGKTLYLGPRDVPLFRLLQEITPETVPGMMQLGRDDFLKLLDSLAGHPRVFFGKKNRVQVALTPFRPPLALVDRRLSVEWPAGVVPLAGESTVWAQSRGDCLQPVAPGLPERFRAIFDRGLVLDTAAIDETRFVLQNFFTIDEALLDQLPKPALPSVELELDGSMSHVRADLFFRYGDERIPAGSGEARLVEGAGEMLVTSPAIEQQAVAELQRWGFGDPDEDGTMKLRDSDGVLRFFAHGFPRLDATWTVTTGEGFDYAEAQVEPVSPVFDFQGSGENWFAMELEFESASGESIPREDILRLIQTGKSSRKNKAGKIAVIDPDLVDELNDVIADCDPRQVQPGKFQIDRKLGGFLRETAGDDVIRVKGTPPWKQAPREPIAFPDTVAEVVRPYQREGIEWMLGLASRGMGGILADDMGLGKTLQTLAAIKAIGGQALVVCPSSLVFNWIAEAEKFLPELNAVAIDGPDRADKLAEHGDDADLLVTSYALLRIDGEVWHAREFDVVILDEAQQIKNPDAQVSKAAHRLNGRHHFALTGTPIENSVRDLWSILQFAMPGYLGSRKDFTERFERPLAKGGAPDLQKRLSRRLRPVILRRLKQQVAADLPEKIEQVVYCEMNPAQRGVYDQILRESRATLFDAEGGRKRMLALTALLRLRQACCDLRLLGLPDVDPDKASIKMDALEEMLTEAIEGGHRVLIFSQFVEMLQVLVPMLAERGLKSCYLDGRTKNRGDVVARFQENDDIPVFLISLKAGGVGLNLTAADTVIHVDPWWNPAVEAQATDRAHRIGQERIVTSYKLITRNTVEEKILALQEKKKAMIASMLDAELEAGDAALSEAELLELLA